MFLILFAGSKNTEQTRTYLPEPLKSLELRKRIMFDGIPYTFQLRFFRRDRQARQFEAGQQRGIFLAYVVFTVKST